MPPKHGDVEDVPRYNLDGVPLAVLTEVRVYVVLFVDVGIGGEVTVEVIRRAQHHCFLADCHGRQGIKDIEVTLDQHAVAVHPDSTVVMRSSHPTAVASHNDEGSGLGVIPGTVEVLVDEGFAVEPFCKQGAV